MSLGDKPAFPGHSLFIKAGELIPQGLTLREFYAGLAMMGNCSNSNLAGDSIDFVTRISIEQADALLTELEKKVGE